ncbi:PAS domain S-box protein [Planctomycetota bacterium]
MTASPFSRICRGGAKKLIECNDKYAEMSGYTREELLAVGDPESLAVTHGSPGEFEENQRKSLAYEPYSGSFSWKRPDGRENYIKYNTAFIYAGGKKLKIGIDHDITNLVKAEKELERHRQRLESLVAERTVELLQVTRELETAQSAIHGFEKQVRKLREERSRE